MARQGILLSPTLFEIVMAKSIFPPGRFVGQIFQQQFGFHGLVRYHWISYFQAPLLSNGARTIIQLIKLNILLSAVSFLQEPPYLSPKDIGNLPVPRGLKSGKVTIHLTWIIILIFTVTRLIHYPFGCTYPWVLFCSYYIPERFAEDLKALFFV